MGRYRYKEGFREQFIQMMKDRRAPKCKMCNRPQRPADYFTTCPRCDWLLCPHCQAIHRPERHDWKQGDLTDLTKCEMCDMPSDDLAPCTACLYMLCPRCRSLHKPEQHKTSWDNVVMLSRQGDEEISRRALARVGNPPHGEAPLIGQFEPDCLDCQKWYEGYKSAIDEAMKLYLEEQEKVWKERYKDIMNDLGISEEEIGGPA